MPQNPKTPQSEKLAVCLLVINIVDCTRTTSSWKQSQINKGQKGAKLQTGKEDNICLSAWTMLS